MHLQSKLLALHFVRADRKDEVSNFPLNPMWSPGSGLESLVSCAKCSLCCMWNKQDCQTELSATQKDQFAKRWSYVQTEYARFENDRFTYRIHRSPMCEYMINFILKLKHLPEKYMMNSVLENFTILQVWNATARRCKLKTKSVPIVHPAWTRGKKSRLVCRCITQGSRAVLKVL